MNPTNENITAGVGGSGDAFEYFSSGASIEEVNERFYPSGSELGADNADVTSAGEENSDAEAVSAGSDEADAGAVDGTSAAEESVESADGGADASQSEHYSEEELRTSSDADNESDVDVKKFSQKEVDSFIGRRISEIKGSRDTLQKQNDSLLSDAAKLLGVSRDEAAGALRDAAYKREAEENDITDVDLFIRAKKAENELAEIKNGNERSQREAFAREVGTQLDALHESYPDADFGALGKSAVFNSALRELYGDEGTRADCVKLAYRAYLSVYGKSSVEDLPSDEKKAAEARAAHGEREKKEAKIRQAVSANARRADEGASSVKSPAAAKQFDYDNMTAADFDKIQERVRNGEEIIL